MEIKQDSWKQPNPIKLSEGLEEDINVERAWIKIQSQLQSEPIAAIWNDKDTSNLPFLHNGNVTELSDENEEFANIPFNNTSKPLNYSSNDNKKSKANQWFLQSKIFRRCLTGAVAVCAFVVVFNSDWGNKALASVIESFRIQHIVGVQEGDFTAVTQALSNAGLTKNGLTSLQDYGQVNHTGGGASQEVSSVEASKQAGFPIKLLKIDDTAKVTIMVRPVEDVTFTLHTVKINELISKLGGKSKFPDSIDGKPIHLHISPQISQTTGRNSDNAINFVQFQSPQLDVSDIADLDSVRTSLLDLPFLPNDMRQYLEGTDNWKNTLFIPMNSSSKNTKVSGNDAVLYNSEKSRAIVWIADGVIYELSGRAQAFDSDQAITAKAEELMR